MTITSRDKKLLVIMLTFVIAALLIRFLILPQMDRVTTNASDLIVAETEKSSMEHALAQKDALEGTIDNSRSEFETATGEYYDFMESYQTERMVTELVLASGLVAKDLTISPTPYVCNPVPYVNSSLAMDYGSGEEGTSEDTENTSGGDSDVSAVEGSFQGGSTGSQNTIYGATVQITAEGTVDQTQQFIDNISKTCPAIRVISYSIDHKEAVDATDTPHDISTLDIVLEVYMCKKSED